MLESAQQKALLAFARQALAAALGVAAPPAEILEDQMNHGVFVTLYAPGRVLRGCIGTFAGGAPLAASVAEMAVAAGLRDPRFAPVTADELPGLRIEISLLSEMHVASAEEIILGEHGVVLKRGFLHSVFLPKVALEQSWTKEELLGELSVKARLPEDAWQWQGSELQVFTAEVFAEA